MESDYSFQRITYVKPTENRYESIGEKPYSKYSCPVCALLGNNHQVSMGGSHCSLCNVNLLWEEQTMERTEQTKQNYTSMSVEALIRQLREDHQMDIYTVDENWCIQLFDLDVCANDIGISCDYETSGKDLQGVLIEALEWSEKRKEED